MKHITTGKELEYNFPSWGDMLQFCKDTPEQGLCASSSRITGNAREAWTMTKNFKEALEMAVIGWPDMAKKASLMAKPYYRKISSLVEREDVTYDIEGIGIDTARYTEGLPECWQKFDSIISSGKGKRILNMIVNVGASCDIDPETMAMKGGYALALLGLLELSGYRVAVKLVIRIERGNRRNQNMTITCVVKSPDQVPDKNRLAFIIAHPAVFRRLGISIMEQHFPTPLGYPKEITPKDGDIYIPNANTFKHKTSDDIEKMLLVELQKQGIIPKKGR